MPADERPPDAEPPTAGAEVDAGLGAGSRWARAGWLAAGGWLIVYLLVWATGQRFDAAYLDYGWQLIPWDVLSHDPIRSVWYLHIQPPLWNLSLGGLAWVSPFSDAITLQAFQAAFGAVGAACAALIARRCRLGVAASVAVALVATAHPEVLRNAFEPTYELAVSTMLLALVLAIARFAGDVRWRLGPLAIAAAGTAVVLTRSLYHPVWLAAILAAALLAARRRVDRRQVLAAIALPLLLIGGWMAKNEALYGRPTLSSWFGMNMQRAVIPVLDADLLQQMHDEGKVSDVAMIGPFGAYHLYAPVMPPCEPSHHHRSVTEPGRTTDPVSPNFNYECYLPVFDQAGKDAWAVIKAHPGAYVEGRLWSARVMFAVSTQPAQSNSFVMRLLDTGYSIARVDVTGAISNRGWGHPIYGDIVARTDFGVTQILLYLGVAAAGLWQLARFRSRTDPVWAAVCVATMFVATWTFVVGVAGELGEQARFRTMTDPVVWVVGICGLVRFWTAWRAARHQRVGTSA